MPVHCDFDPVPAQLDDLLSPAWLTRILSIAYPGVEVRDVAVVETLRTTAAKVRFTVTYAPGAPSAPTAFCVKGFFDAEAAGRASIAGAREADFYTKIAPVVPMRLAHCVYAGTDTAGKRGVVIMQDLVAQGARFYSALDSAVGVDTAAATLGQLAGLHARYATPAALQRIAWLPPGMVNMDPDAYMSATELQALLDGPRGEGLSSRTLDAAALQHGLRVAAARNRDWPQYLIHGDPHAGNIFQTAEGPGIIDWQTYQTANWAFDVAYHINALLDVETAAQNERALLTHYLDLLSGHGVAVPSFDQALDQYRIALIYGYFLWAITRRVDPPIINAFVRRLGSAVERHQSFNLAGV